MKIILLSISLIMLQSIIVWGQNNNSKYENETSQDSVEFFFRIESDLLMNDYRNNEKSFSKLNKLLTNDFVLSRIDSIVILSSASPDGRRGYNYDLAKKRGVALKNYIYNKYSNIDTNKIKIIFSVVDWIDIKERITNDLHFPDKDKALYIISNYVEPEMIESRLKHLNNDKVWTYIVNNYLSDYRTANTVFCFVGNVENGMAKINDQTVKKEIVVMPIVSDVEESQEVVENSTNQKSRLDATPSLTNLTDGHEYKPLFALKTNLLFDAATILNLEVEIPIGKRFSIAAEGMFPWWILEKKQIALQILSGNVEGRYWFGKRENRPLLTGWFVGIYAGGGMYDLEWKRKGYQGEFYIAAGVSGGFAHTINKSGTLRMEYSLGLGYLSTDYRKYEAVHSSTYNSDAHGWKLIRKDNGSFNWFGPTKAKVSLAWMLNRKVKKGGSK